LEGRRLDSGFKKRPVLKGEVRPFVGPIKTSRDQSKRGEGLGERKTAPEGGLLFIQEAAGYPSRKPPKKGEKSEGRLPGRKEKRVKVLKKKQVRNWCGGGGGGGGGVGRDGKIGRQLEENFFFGVL